MPAIAVIGAQWGDEGKGKIVDLLAEKESVSEELYSLAEHLEGYAVEVRYPDVRQNLIEEDAQEAFHIATKIKKILLGAALGEDHPKTVTARRNLEALGDGGDEEI